MHRTRLVPPDATLADLAHMADRIRGIVAQPAGPADTSQLVDLALLDAAVRLDALPRAVQQARAAGMSWRTIGAALGVSGQAAHERFGATRPLLDELGVKNS